MRRPRSPEERLRWSRLLLEKHSPIQRPRTRCSWRRISAAKHGTGDSPLGGLPDLEHAGPAVVGKELPTQKRGCFDACPRRSARRAAGRQTRRSRARAAGGVSVKGRAVEVFGNRLRRPRIEALDRFDGIHAVYLIRAAIRFLGDARISSGEVAGVCGLDSPQSREYALGCLPGSKPNTYSSLDATAHRPRQSKPAGPSKR